MTTTSDGTPTLDQDELDRLDAYWRAANFLSVGQIYLLDNPLLREPLRAEHIKPRLLGHFGTVPGLNLVYTHLNRAICGRDLDAIFITGPGHGGPGIVANAYLEGTYSEVYPAVSRDLDGMRALFRQFSFPGGIPSHVAPETPGSIHEGGELGYALSHAYGAAFDNPDLLVACVIGDGEAETGPLAASWHSNKWIDPARDGAVLPILHLNGYKIANPAVLARIPEEELRSMLTGFGYEVHFVTGDVPADVHQQMAAALDSCLDAIADIQRQARDGKSATGRPRWPMIVLRTPKGWTGPKSVDGRPVEGTWRAHQVPMADVRDNPAHLALLDRWMRSYRPDELFDDGGALRPDLANLAPTGERRMSANPHANGGLLLRDLRLPDFRDYAVTVPTPGGTTAEATRVLGELIRDVIKLNPESFRLFGPDETASNRLQAVFEATDKAWMADMLPVDEHLAPDGRVLEILSEHTCQGWLEGYLLTGRHGLFNCYEAFIHIVDSMFNQHAKWLKTTREIPWRRPIASLNYLLSSHVWRQDHNGFSHQDPGFIDHVVNKKPDVIRVYLPPDANTLLSVADHCLRSRNYVNVIVAGKQPSPQWLSMDEAVVHSARGIGIWQWASSDRRRNAGHRSRLRRRCSDPGDAGRGHHPPRGAAGREGPGGQRCGPHAARGREGAPPRAAGQRVRRDLHGRSTDRLRVPRVSLADSSPDVSAHESRQPPRSRISRGGHDHDAVRHGDAQRPRPISPRHGRDRPSARSRRPRGPCAAAHAGSSARGTYPHARPRRRQPRG